MNISDEAVGHVMDALRGHLELTTAEAETIAHSVIDAAAPHLMAAAWDECEAAKYEVKLNESGDAWEPVKVNPYR